jgi:hypothetical protein
MSGVARGTRRNGVIRVRDAADFVLNEPDRSG